VAAEPAPAGFAEDVLAMLPRLRAYARFLARDPPAADDLVQDTIVLALRAWHQFTPGTNLEGWLLTIERNHFRSLRTRHYVTAEVGVDDLGPLASVPAFQEGLAELRDFKAAFARLSPHHREALVLHVVSVAWHDRGRLALLVGDRAEAFALDGLDHSCPARRPHRGRSGNSAEPAPPRGGCPSARIPRAGPDRGRYPA
jgi:RNA polymerase sigma-70 factor (ECF subfamily)